MEEVSTHILHGESWGWRLSNQVGAGETPLPIATERMQTAEHSFPLLGVLQLSWLQPPRPAQHPIMTAYSDGGYG